MPFFHRGAICIQNVTSSCDRSRVKYLTQSLASSGSLKLMVSWQLPRFLDRILTGFDQWINVDLRYVSGINVFSCVKYSYKENFQIYFYTITISEQEKWLCYTVFRINFNKILLRTICYAFSAIIFIFRYTTSCNTFDYHRIHLHI